ncbi:MAG: GntR family transcriptional regulator [Lentisphaeria bacterium]|nr:GntR family transcriptional regulator [Lentisphaeria bacterium]NQZ70256.1 GntR family transcriptional regulator [Lentisphaeria bacterium]
MKSESRYLYQETENTLLDIISEMEIGDRLPPERELLLNMNVSMITLKRALNNLSDQGILQRFVGRGTFIQQKPDRVDKKVPLLFTWDALSNLNWDKMNPVPDKRIFPGADYYTKLADALRKKIIPDVMFMASQFPDFQEQATFMNLDHGKLNIPPAGSYFDILNQNFSDYSFRFALPLLFSCQLIAVSSHKKYRGLAEELQQCQFDSYLDFADYIQEKFQQPTMFFPEYLQLYLSQSSEFFDPQSGASLFDIEAGRTALIRLKKGFEDGIISNPYTSSIPGEIDLFQSGKRAIVGPIFAFSLRDLSGKFDLILPPFGKDNANIINAIGLTIHSESKQSDLSAKLLTSISSEKSVMKLAREGRGFPADKSLCKQFLKENYPLLDFATFEDEIAGSQLNSFNSEEKLIHHTIIEDAVDFLSGTISLSDAAGNTRQKLAHLVKPKKDYLNFPVV